MQWLRQLQDPTPLELALIAVLAELLLVLDLEPLALQVALACCIYRNRDQHKDLKTFEISFAPKQSRLK